MAYIFHNYNKNFLCNHLSKHYEDIIKSKDITNNQNLFIFICSLNSSKHFKIEYLLNSLKDDKQIFLSLIDKQFLESIIKSKSIGTIDQDDFTHEKKNHKHLFYFAFLFSKARQIIYDDFENFNKLLAEDSELTANLETIEFILKFEFGDKNIRYNTRLFLSATCDSLSTEVNQISKIIFLLINNIYFNLFTFF